jgi:hypothetical protein
LGKPLVTLLQLIKNISVKYLAKLEKKYIFNALLFLINYQIFIIFYLLNFKSSVPFVTIVEKLIYILIMSVFFYNLLLKEVYTLLRFLINILIIKTAE